VNTVAYLGGAAAMAPLTLSLAAGFPFGTVTARGWASLLYMALFPSMVCYLIYYYALTHIPASRLSAFSYLQPLLATLLALALLGERISGGLAAGGALVLAGVYLTERG
jgi:drug/metabolite transporter (DMT)-like permease